MYGEMSPRSTHPPSETFGRSMDPEQSPQHQSRGRYQALPDRHEIWSHSGVGRGSFFAKVFAHRSELFAYLSELFAYLSGL